MSLTFTVRIDCDNAAFCQLAEGFAGANHEVARILRELAKKVERDGAGHRNVYDVRDVNGNSVGEGRFIHRDEAAEAVEDEKKGRELGEWLYHRRKELEREAAKGDELAKRRGRKKP